MANKTIKTTKEHLKLYDRVLSAEKFHEEQFCKKAKEAMRLLRGSLEYLPDKWSKDKAINPNLIYSTIRNYVPALLPQNIKTYIKPVAPEWGSPPQDNVLSAFLLQNAIDRYRYNLDWEKTEKQAVLCGLVQGLSYGWKSWVFEKGNYNPAIVKDCPAYRYVSGIDLIPDPDCIEFEDKSFVARMFGKRNLDDNTGEDGDPKSSANKSVNYLSGIPKSEPGMPSVPKYYEVYDKNTEKIYIMSGESSNALVHKEDDFDISKGYPFDPLMFNPMIDSYYPMSLVEVIMSMQKTLTILMTWLSEHTKRALPKIIYFEEFLDKKGKQNLQNDIDMGLVALKRKGPSGDNIRIEDVIKVLNPPNMPSEFGMTMSLIRDFINILSGVPENARAGSGADKTATEAGILNSYLQSRYSDYRSITDKFIVKNTKKIIGLIKDNASHDEFLRFNEKDLMDQYFYNNPGFQNNERVSKRGGFVFYKWNKKDVSGDYDIEVGTGTTLPINEEFEYKKAVNNLNIMARDPYWDQEKVHTHFAEALKIPNPEQWKAKPQGPPPPEKPKVSISIKFEELSPETQQMVLQTYDLLPKPPAPAGPGQGGGFMNGQPLDQSLSAEMNVPGLQHPPGMPE
jgi:hypothetical protein